ncbi:hypothetical protein [Rhodohalobacter mucosus]|uniref:Transposase IS200-like domain-containing protein n=1 Tax=Rhodohalobacter mucosus TaxID=2079485 RepID=A0A316U3F3_9BACT|nr:hypothetical protein [Rhodohalobacter mucosus]PWN07966.1 hypothetical protein DDZ15_02845 [Rhodohalobacter mucosus]
MVPIEEGNFYHLYNRGANRSKIFWSDSDFRKFIELYRFYLYPAVETYSWCLLRNHFHFLVRVRTKEDQTELFKRDRELFKAGFFHGKLNPATSPYNVSRQLSHLMNRYTRFINKKRQRSGTLIQGPIKRKHIANEAYFLNLICYIHKNPIHHGIVDNYSSYLHSSYKDIIGTHPTFMERDKIHDLFGGIHGFLSAHQEYKLDMDID